MKTNKELNVWADKGGSINSGKHLTGEGFEISYVPRCFDTHTAETALIINNKYYILDGDFRIQYSDMLNQGIEGVVSVFKKHQKEDRSWSSNTLEELENDMKILAPNGIQSFIQE